MPNPYTRQQETRVSGKEFDAASRKAKVSALRDRPKAKGDPRSAQFAKKPSGSGDGIGSSGSKVTVASQKGGAPLAGRGNEARRPVDAHPNPTGRGTSSLGSRTGRSGQGLTDDGDEIKKARGRG